MNPVYVGKCLLFLLLCSGCSSPSQKIPPSVSASSEPAQITNSLESLTDIVRDSIVTITPLDREGRENGIGAGFIIDAEGLIATSLHVIGEARPLRVHLADGRQVEVTEVFASDRKFDLAILRVAAGKVPALKLGDSDRLAQGAPVVAVGNPLGLRHSVVHGVVSARREVDGVEMIQLAIPIEPGNSGGPLLDSKGRVQGVLTMKSALTPNLGFAMPGNLLKTLLDRPNPVAMERWLNLSALDPREWTPLFGARWTRKGGRIAVEGAGDGFGGRSLCLWQQTPPARPFDISVSVRLDDEAGAAGLVFGADGQTRHYGFYPSAGQLRLTRFDGPNVFSWQVLRETATPHYRRGDWNLLRVRVQDNTLQCYVNGELVWAVEAGNFAGDKVGLAKFRDTRAEFKGFQMGTNLALPSPVTALPADLSERIGKLSGAPDAALLEALTAHPGAARALLAERARTMERDAAQVRELADRLHRAAVNKELVWALDAPEDKIDLFHAALLVAKLDNPDLDVEPYRRQLMEMARELRDRLPARADGAARLMTLRQYLFAENGFHGSRSDFYNRANSYVNQVLDDREGLPITLSVLFMELARAIGLDRVTGLPLPGHFMVRWEPSDAPPQIIDVFNGGKAVTQGEAQEVVASATGEGFREEHLKPATKREIILRMLRNLHGLAERSRSMADQLRYLDALVALGPGNILDRLARARLRLQLRDTTGAKEDLKWLLDRRPSGLDLEPLAELYRSL